MRNLLLAAAVHLAVLSFALAVLSITVGMWRNR